MWMRMKKKSLNRVENLLFLGQNLFKDLFCKELFFLTHQNKLQLIYAHTKSYELTVIYSDKWRKVPYETVL